MKCVTTIFKVVSRFERAEEKHGPCSSFSPSISRADRALTPLVFSNVKITPPRNR